MRDGRNGSLHRAEGVAGRAAGHGHPQGTHTGAGMALRDHGPAWMPLRSQELLGRHGKKALSWCWDMGQAAWGEHVESLGRGEERSS